MNTQSPSITFKAKLGDDLRRWTASGDTSFAEVLQRVSDLFNIPFDSTVIRYTDDEGDQITMVCDDDLAEAIAIVATDSGTKVVLRLEITSKQTDTKKPAAPVHSPLVDQAAKQAEKAVAQAAKEAEKAALAAKDAAEVAAKSAQDLAPHFLSNIHAELAKAGLNHAGLQSGIANMHAELARAGLDQAGLQTHLTAAMGNLQESLPAVMEQVTAALTPRSQIHSNVTCDACEMHPIVGVRYKKRGENYDLCEQDFNKLPANEKEKFLRINRPEQPWRPQRNPQPCSTKPQARFVEHVNLPDGTEILPGTEFTKIWRLRNTGDQPWPENTRLVFTGGDKFAGDDYAEVAPAPAGSEVEVAISLTAPTECGRYVSYWRLAVPPAMKKFGQRIWVQVLIVRDDGSVTFEECEQVQHENVQCDICDAVPIIGERFRKKGEDYDLCSKCFDGLDEHARCAFELIARPGDDAIDMNPADELEARHGWDTKTIASVQASPVAALVEGLQSVLSRASFNQVTQAIEPVFTVPEKFMNDCLLSIEPVLKSMSEANAKEKLAELYSQVEHVMANPKKVAKEMAKAIKDATKVAKCEAKKAAKQAKKAAKQVKKAMKAEDKSKAWVEEMIGLYGLSHMCTYPYREDFGIDGPDGNPIWGKAAEECWKQHFDGDMEQAFMETQEEMLEEMQEAGIQMEVVQDPYNATDPYAEEEMQDAVDPVANTTSTEIPVCSMQEALAEMGIQQADLTTSMFAEIESVVSSEAEAAAARAEADAIAQSEVEAALVEATAAFEAECLAQETAKDAAAAAAAEEAAAKAAAEEAAAQAAAEEAAAQAAAEEAAAKAAAEEAAAQAAAEEAAAKAAAEEAAAQAAAEEAAAKAAAEEAAAKDAAEAEESLAEQLVAMGFEHQMAVNAIQASNGNMEEAINFMLQQPMPEPEEASAPKEPVWQDEWDQMLEELVEMGFECEQTNRSMISEHKGNLKDAVKGLVDHERASRKPA